MSAMSDGAQANTLDILELDHTAKRYLIKGLHTESLHRGQTHFLAFCMKANYKAVPASEPVSVHIVSYQAKEKLKCKNTKVYFSAIHFLHICEREEDPLHPTPDHLQYILHPREIKRVKAYIHVV